MPLIDERGRLFGRMNLIDALAILVGLVLIPVAYTGFLLFRTPAPRITAVEPAEVPLGQEMRVKVKGTGLRSLFRANIGETSANAYLFENEQSADVLFSHVGPGKYDLALYDGVQEVARVRNAITVLAPTTPPFTKVQITGVLVGLDEARARQIVRGARFPSSGSAASEILALGSPRPDERWIKTADSNIAVPERATVQVPVVLRTECQLVDRDECRIGGSSIAAGVIVPLPGTNGTLRLLVDTVRPDADPQAGEVVLRVVTLPELAALIKVGDRDDVTGVDAGQATVVALLNKQTVMGERATRLGDASPGLMVESKIPDRFVSCQLVLRIGLDRAGGGWRYKGQAIMVGAPLTFSTGLYTVRGSIQSVTLKSASPTGQGPG